MKEKYCLLPISTCEFGTDRKADCENCDLNKRFRKITIDNWESYIEDRKTGKEYGADIDPLLNLLNDFHEENKNLKKECQTKEHLLNAHIDFLKSKGYTLKDIIDFCRDEIEDALMPQLLGDVE